MLKLARVLFVLLISVFALSLVGCSNEPEPQAETDMGQGAQPAEPTVSGTLQEAGVTIESTPIHFAFDRYDLSKDAQNVLRAKAELLKAFPQISVKIEGHCDNRGTEEYNLALGERRAKAAYDYLVMLGVQPSQINTVSYGEMYPAAEGQDETAWSKNRRDEFRPTIR